MSFPPWRKLKDLEIAILSQLQDGSLPSATDVATLRVLFADCAAADDATDAICYHGAAAIIAIADGDISTAIKHRQIEIQKIKELHIEERRNPTDGYATQNYNANDLQFRIYLLQELRNAG